MLAGTSCTHGLGPRGSVYVCKRHPYLLLQRRAAKPEPEPEPEPYTPPLRLLLLYILAGGICSFPFRPWNCCHWFSLHRLTGRTIAERSLSCCFPVLPLRCQGPGNCCSHMDTDGHFWRAGCPLPYRRSSAPVWRIYVHAQRVLAAGIGEIEHHRVGRRTYGWEASGASASRPASISSVRHHQFASTATPRAAELTST
jgi:hypothetical protein